MIGCEMLWWRKWNQRLLKTWFVWIHPVLFGITFDKVTLLKRSVQTTVLITFVDGVLTPIYLQSPPCKAELSGQEWAEKWIHRIYLDTYSFFSDFSCIRVMNSFGLSKIKRYWNSSSLAALLMAHRYTSKLTNTYHLLLKWIRSGLTMDTYWNLISMMSNGSESSFG